MNNRTSMRDVTALARVGSAGQASVENSMWSTLTSSLFLIMGRLAAPSLGFLSWLLAARLYEREQVGLASGVVAAMMICVQVALMGIGQAVIALVPEQKERPARLLNTAFTVVAGATLLAALLFLTLATGIFDELSVVATQPAYALAFVGMTTLGTLGVMFDNISISLRRGDQVLLRNIFFGLITVVGVVAVPWVTGVTSSLSILLAWVVANVGACSLGAWQLWRALAGYRYRPQINASIVRQLFAIGLPNYGLTLTERTPAQILPIVVVELLSPAANATWYAVWQMAWVIFVIPWSFAQTLFAEAARRPEALAQEVKRSIRSALAIGAAAALATAIAAPFILLLLGESYQATGVLPLRILVLSALPATFVQMYFAVCRARQKLGEATLMALLNGAVGVGAAALAGINYDLTGMALAWLATQVISGGWSYWRLRRMV